MKTLRTTPQSNAMKLHLYISLSRKRLREELHVQAKVSRQKLIRRDGAIEQAKPMPIKLRIQGNDAITRLLNVGRFHQGGVHDAAKDSVENVNRVLNAGACSLLATERVVAGSP